MNPLALYCKSYSTDLRRVVRLMQSIERFNETRIPVYVSVPEAELVLFREHLGTTSAQLISDESILRASPRLNQAQVARMHGAVAQQVVKSEFWRLGLAKNYLCLDSDCVFIRPFFIADFMGSDGVPFTVLHQNKEYFVFKELISNK